MQTSLSPIAVTALLVGPGLAAWARQDAPTSPAPPAPATVRVDVPLAAEEPDAQDPTDEERALQDKLRALEQRAAELEAALRDRLDAAEAQAGQRGLLKELLRSDEGTLEAYVQEYVRQVDPERMAHGEVALRDLLEAAPERIAEIQDGKVKAKVLEAVEKAKAKLDPEAMARAEEFRARAEEMRALAEARRNELEQSQYKETHARYRQLRERVDDFQAQSEEAARAEMRARRDEGARRRMEQELAQVRRDEEAIRRDADNARAYERELAKREEQRRREENRLRSELDKERARLEEMRAQLERARVEVRRNVPRAEAPRATDLWVQRVAPRAEPQRPTSSDVTIIVEQGDVHVHTGGGAMPVITSPAPRVPQGNVFFDRTVPAPTPPTPPSPSKSQGTTQAPQGIRYWSTPIEQPADPNSGYRRVRTFTGTTGSFPIQPTMSAIDLVLPEIDLTLPDISFSDVLHNVTIPEFEVEAMDVFFDTMLPTENAPECDAKPTPDIEPEGDVVVTSVRAYPDFAAFPDERAPTQAELLDRILQLSEELKAEVGALRGELRELRDVVRGAPRR